VPRTTKKKHDLPTEERIKAAARKVFLQKGSGASRTRDIAEEAGINLALLNYYFRSKEKLFHEIMMERVEQLFGTVAPILMDSSTTLEKKIELMAARYIDLLLENPDLPMFVLHEIRVSPDFFKSKMNLPQLLLNSSLLKQLQTKRKDINPAHFLMNIMGLMLFPFIAKPIFFSTGIVNEKNFRELMEQRRKLIPRWTKAILQTK